MRVGGAVERVFPWVEDFVPWMLGKHAHVGEYKGRWAEGKLIFFSKLASKASKKSTHKIAFAMLVFSQSYALY